MISFKHFLENIPSLPQPSWRNEKDEQQMKIDPPEDPSNMYHVTTDRNLLNQGGGPSTSSFGRQGFHVFDNFDDAQWYHENLLSKGYNKAEVLRVSIPVDHLKADNEHMGRAYIAKDFRPEYLVRT